MKRRFGLPLQCRLCLRFAAFPTNEGPANLCVSCKTSLAQFGNPVPCDQCRAVRVRGLFCLFFFVVVCLFAPTALFCLQAFNKPSESRAKVGGAVLCFSCTKRHKDAAKQKSASSSTASNAAKRDFSAVSSSSTSTTRSSTTTTTTTSATSSTAVVKRSMLLRSAPAEPSFLIFQFFFFFQFF
jgi:hypothetical protein